MSTHSQKFEGPRSDSGVFPGEPDEVFFNQQSRSSGPDASDGKNFQKADLPQGAKFVSATPELTDRTIPKPILCRHMAPRGKYGKLVVTEGALEFIWEDSGELLDAEPGHPVIIFPERYHHVQTAGPVKFRIEFYENPEKDVSKIHADAIRPGESFIP